MKQESKMYYRDEDKSMKGLQESPLFTADEGPWVEDIVLLNIYQRFSLNKIISAAIGMSEPAL